MTLGREHELTLLSNTLLGQNLKIEMYEDCKIRTWGKHLLPDKVALKCSVEAKQIWSFAALKGGELGLAGQTRSLQEGERCWEGLSSPSRGHGRLTSLECKVPIY